MIPPTLILPLGGGRRSVVPGAEHPPENVMPPHYMLFLHPPAAVLLAVRGKFFSGTAHERYHGPPPYAVFAPPFGNLFSPRMQFFFEAGFALRRRDSSRSVRPLFAPSLYSPPVWERVRVGDPGGRGSRRAGGPARPSRLEPGAPVGYHPWEAAGRGEGMRGN